MRELVNVFRLSKKLRDISKDPTFWQSLYLAHFFDCPTSIDWRSTFITTWYSHHTNDWDDSPEIRSERYDLDYQIIKKTVINGKPYSYMATRTKHGFTSGTHYWEVTPHKCQHSCYNTYIGVSLHKLNLNWFLGKDETGWGLKGHQGEFHHQNKPIAHSKTFTDDRDLSNKIKSFFNDKPVGLLLDMDNCTLDYFVEGIKVLSFKENNWKVQKKIYLQYSKKF